VTMRIGGSMTKKPTEHPDISAVVGTSVASLLFNAPLTGIALPSRTLHAIDDPIPSEHRITLDARCGARVKLMPVPYPTDTGTVVVSPMLWRPTPADGFTLCPDCALPEDKTRSVFVSFDAPEGGHSDEVRESRGGAQP
jgi:hypothetical protein